MVSTVAEYIENFDGLTRERLDELRRLVLDILPDAVEGISYGIAEFRVQGKPVVYLGGFTKHVSVFPITDLPAKLDAEVAQFRSGKGTARFSNTEPLPRDLIERLVRYLADRGAGA